MSFNKALPNICSSCGNEDISYIRKLLHKSNADQDVFMCSLYEQKSILFKEGFNPKGVYVVHSGKLKVYKELVNGKEQIIHIAKQGELVGIRALFSGQPYNVSALTLEDSDIGFINASNFQHLIDSIPELRDQIIHELSSELVNRIDFITNMAQKSVRVRFSHSLLILSSIYNDQPINLSREDMASFIGIATETLIRILTEFKKENIIEIKGRKIKIIDEIKLKSIALD